MDDHDLDAVAKKIHEAHDAEDSLMETMPNAIHPDDEDHPGMNPPEEHEPQDDEPQDDDQT